MILYGWFLNIWDIVFWNIFGVEDILKGSFLNLYLLKGVLNVVS